MKRLSDYQGEDAIILWGELLTPVSQVLSDKEVAGLIRNRAGKTMLQLATEIIRLHAKEVTEIFQIVDPDEPVNGLTVVLRLANILSEIGTNPELKSFFGFAEQASMASESTGSATAIMEDGVK